LNTSSIFPHQLQRQIKKKKHMTRPSAVAAAAERDVFNEMGIADSIKGVNNARAAASSGHEFIHNT
jgi:hypothetical protein